MLKLTFIFFFIFYSLFARADYIHQRSNSSKINKKIYNKINIQKTKSINSKKQYVESKEESKKYYINKISTNIYGIELKDNIDFLYNEYENKQVTDKEILLISEKIVNYFIKLDYLLPQITINSKSLEEGMLTFTVKIESLSDVVIIGESNQLLKIYAKKILESEPTTIKKTQKYLALMNKIPGYEVSYKLREDIQDEFNKRESSVALILVVAHNKAESLAMLDNYGINELGKTEAIIDTQIFSPFADSDTLSFDGLTTNHPDRLYDVGVKYSFPVNYSGTRTYFIATHAEDNINKKSNVSVKNSQQNSFSFLVTHPLYLTTNKDLELEVGLHLKTLDDYGISSTNTEMKTEKSKYWFSDLQLEYLFKDSLSGHNIIQTKFAQGINGKFQNYQTPSMATDKHFNYLKLEFYREQNLVNEFSIFSHLAIKYSNKKLPDQELFVFGGREFGRGYEFANLYGNRMVGLSLEARYDRELDYKIVKHIQPYIFFDTSYIGVQNTTISKNRFSSAGAGFRLKFYQDIDLAIEMAQPFTKSYTFSETSYKENTRLNIMLNKVFKFVTPGMVC